jgi:hypothetical protein
LRDRDDLHALIGQLRQELRQRSEGLWMRVAYADGAAVPPGMADQPIELSANIFRVDLVVEKHIALGVRQPDLAGDVPRHGTYVGPAVNEVQVAGTLQRLHQPAHGLRLLCEPAAHMVVYTRDMRHAIQAELKSCSDIGLFHPVVQSGRSEPAPGHGLHGQVQHDLLALEVGQLGDPTTVGSHREHRVGHRGRECYGLAAEIETVAEVVDDDRDADWLIGNGNAEREPQQTPKDTPTGAQHQAAGEDPRMLRPLSRFSASLSA